MPDFEKRGASGPELRSTGVDIFPTNSESTAIRCSSQGRIQLIRIERKVRDGEMENKNITLSDMNLKTTNQLGKSCFYLCLALWKLTPTKNKCKENVFITP